ncbi:MAG: mandelate racemase/muconate lactonizing enzyme family protein, partial [Actinobacteria bacterium]|nr:mandelate racemase/muconate lactonizing enzyme family protein [Actinomycetota bacterium]
NVAWLEDFVLAHDVDAIAELKKSTTTPIIASEMLISKYQYRQLMERRAADIIMIDPTWVGGITESRKVTALAESFGLPVAMHDCTGPFTLLAGLHLSLSSPNAIYQESVRAYIRTWYSELVPNSVEIVEGHILPLSAPGIGSYLLPEVFKRSDATVVTST